MNGEKEACEKRKFDIHKVVDSYLLDIQLTAKTVNQSIVVDEENEELYATQTYKFEEDKVDSFYISRTSLGGQLLDSMLVRFGGHGTSIGLETTSSDPFIWSNMIKTDEKGQIQTQWLCRFPYIPEEEIDIDNKNVEKYLEFPNSNQYMTPFSDPKNNLLALRHTDTSTGTDKSKIEIFNLPSVKKKEFQNPVYSYSFPEDLNKEILQGFSFDHSNLFLSFGADKEFQLYQIDLETSEIVGNYTKNIGKGPDGDYIGDYGEPEGLFLYTDPINGFQTLLTVIVGDVAGDRRQRLFALSSNVGVQKFNGLINELQQPFKLVRDDYQAKKIDLTKYSAMYEIREPGCYYITMADSNKLNDHPMKKTAGWWLYVSGTDTAGSYNQWLVRNSGVEATILMRISNPDGSGSPWFQLQTMEV